MEPASLGGGWEEDGPTTLKIILSEIDPSLMVGTDQYRRIIQTARLNKCNYNVKEGLDQIEWAFKQITLRKETYDSLSLHTFDFLLSAKNADFLTWVKRVQSEICSGSGEYKKFTVKNLISAAMKQ